MAKINIILDRRYKRKDNTYPLKITIFRDKTIYIPINIYIKEENWDKVTQQLIGTKYRNLNIFLTQKKTECQAKLLELQNKGLLRYMSNEKLEKYLNGENDDEKPHLFCDYIRRYIDTLTNERTKELYIATERKMQKYCSYDELTFEEMNVSWLREFDKWMMKDSPSANSRSIHLRNIRTIFNLAIDDEYVKCYPFRRFKINKAETPKRSISVEDMRKLRDMELPAYQIRYRDCFLLMFYLIGINIADLSKLTIIENGRINYVRSKTHKAYSIKVEPEAMAIIEKYRGTEHLLEWFDKVKNYKIFAMKCNKHLVEISKNANLPHLTTYVSRHSWSTYASEIDIPRDVISHALGHSTNVTDTYIRFNWDKVDEANRKVIDYFIKE